MRNVLRAVVLLVVFVGVAILTYEAVISRAPVRYGAYAPEVRLAAEMAGLFAGGIAVAAVGIAMVWGKRQG